MTIADSRVVATTCANHVAGETGYVTFHSRVRFGVDLVPLSLLAEAESRIVELQSRLDGVPEIISGLEMANAALIGSDHAHRDIQKAIDFLRSAALGGECRGDGEVGK